MAKRSPYLSDNPDKGMLDICGVICLQCVVCTVKRLKKDCFQNPFKIVVQTSQNHLEQYKISFMSNQG